MISLKGRVALATGSARSMGVAVAERLARDGAADAINDATFKQDAQAVAERIRSTRGKATVIKADLGSPEQAKALVEQTVSELGHLDSLVNNAGITIFTSIEESDEEHIRTQFAVNVECRICATQAAVPRLTRERTRSGEACP